MRNRKIIFLFLNQNIHCGYSKEPSRWDGSFEHPKHMLKIMGKKIFTILRYYIFVLVATIYSQISVIRTSIIRNYWVIRRRWTVPTFFHIIYCNKTTYYWNFNYPKKSIFRSDSSVPIKENAIKLPFKIRSPNATHGDHDFLVWSSSIYTPEWFRKESWDR